MSLFLYAALALAAVLVLGATYGYGHHRGSASVQSKWDASTASQRLAAAALAEEQARASNAILVEREDRIRELENSAPAVRTVVRNSCLRLPTGDSAFLPAHPPGAGLRPADARDRAIPYDPSNDVIAARKLRSDYIALRGWVLANGGKEP